MLPLSRTFAMAALPIALAFSVAHAARPAPSIPAPTPDAVAHEAWRAALAHVPLPANGCFAAAFPNTRWTSTACTAAPNIPYLPRRGSHHGYTVGNGNDYAAVAATPITSGVGSFPVVTGLRSERGAGNRANAYSLQQNSNFFTTTVCNGATNPSSCLGWEQFVYSNTSRAAFMQYWLINYGTSCPSGGWMQYQGSCYRNSNAVRTPTQAASQLQNLKITGSAVGGGTDTMVFTTASSAYSTTGADSVVNLAAGWAQSEYNVVGDGGGSGAKFNRGTSITVQIALTDGSSAAPGCQANDGTTGETNNLNLGSCSTAGGSTPTVTFAEHN